MPKWFNGTILGLLYKRYIDPSWGSAGPIRQIVVDFPEIRELETRMIKESQRINSIQNDRYATDRSSTPIAARNAERYEMLDRAISRVAKPENH